jgi:hypothetical protein
MSKPGETLQEWEQRVRRQAIHALPAYVMVYLVQDESARVSA